MCGIISEASVLFHYSIYLFWYQYHAVLVTAALWCSLKSGSVMPPALFFLLRIYLGYTGSFLVHKKFKVGFSNSVKKVNGSLLGIALTLQITLGSMAIFMKLILPNHEHEIFFRFVCVLSYFLEQWFMLSLKRCFISLVSCISRYFILFVVIGNGNSLMIWLSVCLLLVHRNACDFCTLFLYPKTLLNLLISLRSFWAEAMGSFRYTIMSSANRDNLASTFPI